MDSTSWAEEETPPPPTDEDAPPDVGEDGRARKMQPLELATAEDRRLDEHGRDLIRLREEMETLPETRFA